MPDSSHKHSAVALRDRHLATISKRGGWHAEITDAGRYYLEHGDYPAEPEAPPRAQVKTASPKAQSKASVPVPAAPRPPRQAPAPKPEVAPSRVVPVPQHLVNPHRVVEKLRDSKHQLAAPDSLRKRALRIIQALAVAAEGLGWTIQTTEESRTFWGHPWNDRDLFVINTGETCEGVRLLQENHRAPHVPTAFELSGKGVWSYRRIPDYDYTPSNRLRLELDTSWDGRRHTWGDTQRWALDDELDKLIDEVEVRSRKAREKRLEREAQEEAFERQRVLAVESAMVGVRESHRAKTLRREAEDWRTANELRSYLDAMATRIEGLSGSEAEAAQGWLAWCRRHAENLDPLGREIHMPEDPAPTEEALAPFLDRRFR